MEEIINDEHVTLDYNGNRTNEKYRLSIFDNNCHYIDEFYLDEIHLKELMEGLKKFNFDSEETI